MQKGVHDDFLPLPASFLRQLADERHPRRSGQHDTAPVGTRRPPHHGVEELSVVEALGLEPELRSALIRRVTRDRATASSVISEALRQYLAS